MKNFSIFESIQTGWRITRANFLFLLSAVLITYLAHMVVVFLILTIKSISIGEFIHTTYPTWQSYFIKSFPFGAVSEFGTFWTNVSSAMAQLFTVGFFIILINLYDRKTASLTNFLRVFRDYRLLLNVIAAWLLICIPVFLFTFFLKMNVTNILNYAGKGSLIAIFFIFIILASLFFLFWFAVRLGFTILLIIDRSKNFLKAFQFSFDLTRGVALKIGLLASVIGLFSLAGSMTIVGSVVAWPLSNLAFIHAYRTLLKQQAL